jgi:hypothetical protein
MQFKIIDNFLADSAANRLFELIVQQNAVPLNTLPTNVTPYKNINPDLFQHTRSFTQILMRANQIEFMPAAEIINIMLQNIMDRLQVRFVVSSIRINHMNQSCAKPTLKYDIPHVDIQDIGANMYTLIYYVNNSDGETILYDQTCRGSNYDNEIPLKLTCLERISPRKNRVLLFNANQLHSAPAYCTEDRYVINLNITTEFSLDYDQL